MRRRQAIGVTLRALAAASLAPHATMGRAQTRGRDGVIRTAFPVAESGFDPQAVSDTYSADLCNVIFEPLYGYDYFARPVKLVPAIADRRLK